MKEIILIEGQAFSKTRAESTTRNSLCEVIEHIAKIFTKKDGFYDATWRAHIAYHLLPIFHKVNNVKTRSKKMSKAELDEMYTDEVGCCHHTVGNILFKEHQKNVCKRFFRSERAFKTEAIAKRKVAAILLSVNALGFKAKQKNKRTFRTGMIAIDIAGDKCFKFLYDESTEHRWGSYIDIASDKCFEFLEPALFKLKNVVIDGLLRETVNPAAPRTASQDERVLIEEDMETAKYLAKLLTDATIEARKEALK